VQGMPLATRFYKLFAFFYGLIRSIASSSIAEVVDENYLLESSEELTDTTTQTSRLFSDWASFSVESKTKLVMLNLLMQELNFTQQQAFEQWQNNKQSLSRLLDKRRHKALQAVWQDLFSSQRRQISVALTIKKWLVVNPLSSYEDVLAQARYLYHQAGLPTINIEELRLYQLKEVLDSWIDWQTVQEQLPGPLEALKIILAHYKQPFPRHFFSQAFDVDKFPHTRFLYEAALVFNKVHKSTMFAGLEINGTLSTLRLEESYLSVLAEDWQKQQLLEQLFLKPSNDSQAIYFNGLTLKNAAGKTFEDLINDETFEENSSYKLFTSEQRKELLKEKFRQIGESTQYKIGSLAHSMASVISRIIYYQYSLPRQPFQNLEELILVFKLLEKDWQLKKNYPLQPRLVLAYHLAESNNFVVEGKDAKDKIKSLFTYLANAFEMEFPELPHFDRTRAAVKILHEAGMPLSMIDKARYYVIDADDPDLSQTYFGSPLEEFLKRADVVGISGNYMYYGKSCIESKVALQEAEERFNANLYKDPWIQKKARKNLGNSTLALNASAIEKEAKRIAENYETETEDYRAWIQGLKIWISTVPIIGPLYSIGEGIKERDTAEIICGVFFLSVDVFDVLFQGEADEELEIGGGRSRKNLSVRGRMAVDNVEFVFDELGLSLEDLALEDNYLSHTDWYALKKNNVPIEQHQLAERVRNGEQGLKWNEYELVYLSAEDRVVPVKSQGGYFQEVNWVTGEIVSQKPFIFKDEGSKKYYAMRLKGGNPDSIELEESALKQRETVKKTEIILNKAKDYTRYDFVNRYKECFTTIQSSGVSAFNSFEFYDFLYRTSPTFRRVFNRYYESYNLSSDKKIWKLSISQRAVTHTDFAKHEIHIASDIEISQMHYVSNTIHESSRPEQIYLHELLHALTGHMDPVRAISVRHRGPIVYLTDKILSEAGYMFPQRIMYRRLWAC
jgi:hypothetical protein